jgi:NADPH2:quinone reductase
VPDGLGVRDAVALLADGRTAMGLTRVAAPSAGEWVVVEAAAGGVGGLLVQLAGHAGAKVVALAGGTRKLDLATELGAHAAVDYRAEGWAERVRDITGGGAHVVFDGVGGAVGRAAFELVTPGGRFVMYGAASGSFTEASIAEVLTRGVVLLTGHQVFASPGGVRALAVAALAEAVAGRLRPVIGQTFALEDAAEAHAAIEARTTLGKTLLIP